MQNDITPPRGHRESACIVELNVQFSASAFAIVKLRVKRILAHQQDIMILDASVRENIAFGGYRAWAVA